MDISKLKKGDWVKTRDGCWHTVRWVDVKEDAVHVGGFKLVYAQDIAEVDEDSK